MELDHVIDIMHQHAEKIHKLADKLRHKDGEPLDAYEKDLIRSVLADSWLKELQAEQRMFFRDGSLTDARAGSDELVETMKMFM